MARFAGLVGLLGDPVADPGVSGGDLVGLVGLDFVDYYVPGVYLEDPGHGLQVDALGVGLLGQDVTGSHLHVPLG